MWSCLLVASGLSVSCWGGPDPDTAAVMRVKLAAAQRLLGGLAVADFSLVQTNAATLVTLSGQRGWTALQTPEYELFTTRFRIAAEDVLKAAKGRNIDTVASGYNELTLSCVACHKYLRDNRSGASPAQPKAAPK
jgi:hypothetical protein